MPFFGKTKSDKITEVKEFLNKIFGDDDKIAKWTEWGKEVEHTRENVTDTYGKEETEYYTTASFYLKNTFYETLEKFYNLPNEYIEAFKTIFKECSSNCKKYISACEKIMERMNTDWIYLDKTMQKDRVINDSTKKPESIYGINISNGNYEYLSENDFNNLVIFYVNLFNTIGVDAKKNKVETYVTEYKEAKETKAAEAAAKKAAKEAEKEAAAAEKEAAEAAVAAENNKVKAAAEKEKHKKYCEDCAKKCHSEGNDKHSSGGSRYKTKKRRTYKIGKRRTYKIGKRKTPKKKRSYKTGKRGAKRRTRRKI